MLLPDFAPSSTPKLGEEFVTGRSSRPPGAGPCRSRSCLLPGGSARFATLRIPTNRLTCSPLPSVPGAAQWSCAQSSFEARAMARRPWPAAVARYPASEARYDGAQLKERPTHLEERCGAAWRDRPRPQRGPLRRPRRRAPGWTNQGVRLTTTVGGGQPLHPIDTAPADEGEVRDAADYSEYVARREGEGREADRVTPRPHLPPHGVRHWTVELREPPPRRGETHRFCQLPRWCQPKVEMSGC